MTRGGAGISVVVICLHEGRYLDDCLQSIEEAAGCSALDVDVLVVDGGSTDDTVAIATRWEHDPGTRSRVQVVRCDRAGYSHQRNVGVSAARQRWVAFVSADVRVGPDWLRLLEPQLHAGVDLLIGRFDLVTPPGRRPWVSALAATVYPTCTDDRVVERCSTVHLVARREALLATPFDETLGGCEDKDLAFRLCRSPGWRGSAEITHRPSHLAREGLGRFLVKLGREAFELGRLSGRHGPDFPDCFGWRRAACCSLLAAAGIVALWVLSPWWATAGALAGLVAARRHPVGSPRRDPRLPTPAQVVLHTAAVTTISACWAGGRLAAVTAARPWRRATRP